MSGVETVAGLAVGVLPLLIAAAEHYDQCFRPFVRYKKIAKEADHFRNQLNIQRTIFRNQCRLLLEQIVEHDAASCMLKAPEDPSWHDAALDAKIGQLLGESREACVATIEKLNSDFNIYRAKVKIYGLLWMRNARYLIHIAINFTYRSD